MEYRLETLGSDPCCGPKHRMGVRVTVEYVDLRLYSVCNPSKDQKLHRKRILFRIV